ncbi:6-O-methylguanine DNA methyltransferase, DNA binding domain protein [Marvinbryantia formatexigens DSM 14469]|uniref:6-O-methylguanine DNA methyltransferase, DNA binding domain protein n=2 Tax=Marvinbryantia TaxID=248744 RepID=C6LCY1_9FIRM|nr:6-O-methylguanine DNA methyltransferase, DNA binding domain protein [Marvinbryantia formatexigens DSM 14469]
MNPEMNFYERLHIVCNQIPYGTVATYGQLALLCGKPKNSRQVGYALRMGLAGEVPAHRIVNSKGLLSGAGYFEAPDTQKKLLEMEGVEAERTESGYKVDLKRFVWKTTEDEAEAFYYLFREDSASAE